MSEFKLDFLVSKLAGLLEFSSPEKYAQYLSKSTTVQFPYFFFFFFFFHLMNFNNPFISIIISRNQYLCFN